MKPGSNLELNKIAASIFLAGLLTMVAAKLSHIFYTPEPAKQAGILIEVPEDNTSNVNAVIEEIDVKTLLASADIERGKKVAKKCVACHTFDQGGKNGVGPNLYGILGRDIASVNGFNYSKALQNIDGKWDYDKMAAWLKKPKEFAKGNIMSFVGIKKPQQLADIIVYLNSKSATPLAIPAAPAAPTATE